jgi:hypothetical protein
MIDMGCSLQSVLATLCYNLGPLPQHTLIGSCPGDPDNKARPCHFDRGGRDKPGHDGLFCGVVSGPIEFEII